MRATLWFVALFGIAVAAALFAGNNQGTVTVFWPPWRVDLSVNLVILLVLGGFVLLHAVLRSLALFFSLPREARAWRERQKERAMNAALLDAMAHLTAGRFVRARKSALEVLSREQSLVEEGEMHGARTARNARLRALAHLLAAESAHALQDVAMRDQQLRLALQAAQREAGELREGVQMRMARWQLDDRDPKAALATLSDMAQGAARRTLALRIRLKASRQARVPEAALETARLLAKHRAFSADAAQSIVRGLAMDWLSSAHDPGQLERIWQALESRERQMPEIAIHAAQRLMALRGAETTARGWLAPVWDQYPTLGDGLRGRFVRAVEAGMASLDGEGLARLEQIQLKYPRDAALQYLAGMACRERQLWGKARALLTQSVMGLQDAELLRRAWRALAELAEQRGDESAAIQAWRKAATV